jgi:hypothetical protein
VPADEPLAPPAYDYADAFEVPAADDDRTAEEWLRAGLEGSPAALRRLIRLVHGGVLRFALGPESPDHVLGWKILSSSPTVAQLGAEGPLGRGVLVGRKVEGAVVLVTYAAYRHRLGRLVWTLVMVVHRRVAPYLLTRAARSAPEAVRQSGP